MHSYSGKTVKIKEGILEYDQEEVIHQNQQLFMHHFQRNPTLTVHNHTHNHTHTLTYKHMHNYSIMTG